MKLPDLGALDERATPTLPGRKLRIMIVTDAWEPQVNGVVRTMRTVVHELRQLGHTVEVIGPDRFPTIPCPSYPSIRLAVLPRRRLGRLIRSFAPDALHISTEGPLGIAARGWAIRNRMRFTTAFHTRFPEYVQARIGLSSRLSYAFLRRFHGAGVGTMVAAESLRQELGRRGFTNIRAWSRAVDLDLFRPEPRERWEETAKLARPVFLYVGRIAIEKNIEAFLKLDLPGSKAVVGDGPQLAGLRKRYPSVHFAGTRHGGALARAYAGADVFVFPSLTDTFGLVLLEALACGTPVAAFPVTGPMDLLEGQTGIGAIDTDLRRACLRALEMGDRDACRAFAESFSWRGCAETFLANLAAPPPAPTLASTTLAPTLSPTPGAATDLPHPAISGSSIGAE